MCASVTAYSNSIDGNSSQVHQGKRCHDCAMNPIEGARYQCLECTDHDLCETCWLKLQHLHKTKVFQYVGDPGYVLQTGQDVSIYQSKIIQYSSSVTSAATSHYSAPPAASYYETSPSVLSYSTLLQSTVHSTHHEVTVYETVAKSTVHDITPEPTLYSTPPQPTLYSPPPQATLYSTPNQVTVDKTPSKYSLYGTPPQPELCVLTAEPFGTSHSHSQTVHQTTSVSFNQSQPQPKAVTISQTQHVEPTVSKTQYVEPVPVIQNTQQKPVQVQTTTTTAGPTHAGTTCSGCRMSPICGTRYKCTQCPLDYCSQCFFKNPHNELYQIIGGKPLPISTKTPSKNTYGAPVQYNTAPQMTQYNPPPQMTQYNTAPQQMQYHTAPQTTQYITAPPQPTYVTSTPNKLGKTCDKCQVCPIRGTCYNCKFCDSYNLCEKCYNYGHNHPHKDFYALPDPFLQNSTGTAVKNQQSLQPSSTADKPSSPPLKCAGCAQPFGTTGLYLCLQCASPTYICKPCHDAKWHEHKFEHYIDACTECRTPVKQRYHCVPCAYSICIKCQPKYVHEHEMQLLEA